MGSARIEAVSAEAVVGQNIAETLRRQARFIQTVKSGLDRILRVYRTTDLIRLHYDESYSIGLAEFDDRRYAVIDVYNRLNLELRLMAEAAGSGVRLKDTASLLIRLIGELFTFEEALMAEVDYGEFAAHQACHVGFLERLHDEFERIQAGRADMHDLSHLIGSWLSEHMRATDLAFGEFVMGAVHALARTRRDEVDGLTE